MLAINVPTYKQDKYSGEIPAERNDIFKYMVKPHIESFDCMLRGGLRKAVRDLDIGSPMVNPSSAASPILYPSECRIRGITYSSPLKVVLGWSINGVEQNEFNRIIAQLPIMVQSSRCSLKSLSPKQLIECHEDQDEWGGYFICNGIERLLRFLIVQRRNYPIAMERISWKTKAPLMSEFGINIRCVDEDENSCVNILHYLQDGQFMLSFVFKKQHYFLPLILILKILTHYTDYQIFQHLTLIAPNDSFHADAVKDMLSETKKQGVNTNSQAKDYFGIVPILEIDNVGLIFYVGALFRAKGGFSVLMSNEEICDLLMKYMCKKLIGIVTKQYTPESTDTLNNQELLLPGQLYQMVLKDKLETWLLTLKQRLLYGAGVGQKSKTVTETILNTAISRCVNVGQQMEYLIKTGNLASRNSLGLPQATGYSVVADRLNFLRYLSHFRCVHRGAFFAKSYSTTVRRLLPECWGFICPVHTPDGAPCGLLNHLSVNCSVTCNTSPVEPYVKILMAMGLVPANNDPYFSETLLDEKIHQMLTVLIDGNFYGFIPSEYGHLIEYQLRKLKCDLNDRIEVVYVPFEKDPELRRNSPGLYLFTTPSRFSRVVHNTELNSHEHIGSFEQVYMNIALVGSNETTSTQLSSVYKHQEIDSRYIFSEAAIVIPFSDHNQSPRNMYQCQMAKQSLGTPTLSYSYRFDNKLYRLLLPQSPICKNFYYDKYRMDNYPQGMNAVVAVISYTGYDMEDALIINKNALERGFGSACVYKSEIVDLREVGEFKSSKCNLRFGCQPNDPSVVKGFLECDGLPPVGRCINENEPLYSYYDIFTNQYKIKRYFSHELAYVDCVTLLGDATGNSECIRVSIRLRIPRNPIVGDKFASRHGQKGILSIKWNAEDMPFSESGIIPDIIFNPHGFPSRMTIGMMVELMAGKVGSIQAKVFDSSPFNTNRTIDSNTTLNIPKAISSDSSAVDYFGQLLAESGFNYYGTEKMYSGSNGVELEAEIFTGIVYYQRLRHMVSDKFQVRSTGPVDSITQQPVQGRKRGGGVRFGEMERDALISHGCSYLLQERLLHSSDGRPTYVCKRCGDILTVHATKMINSEKSSPLSRTVINPNAEVINMGEHPTTKFICNMCGKGDEITCIMLPQVFKYLISELSAMNIHVKLNMKNSLDLD